MSVEAEAYMAIFLTSLSALLKQILNFDCVFLPSVAFSIVVWNSWQDSR